MTTDVISLVRSLDSVSKETALIIVSMAIDAGLPFRFNGNAKELYVAAIHSWLDTDSSMRATVRVEGV